jgi:protein TonB
MNGADTHGDTFIGRPGNAPPSSPDERPDYLSTMLFVAALFHGVLILGVSFTAGDLENSSQDSASMEVVILNRDYDLRPDSTEAAYLAQQSLSGSGTTEENVALRVAYGRDSDPIMPGPEQDGANNQMQQQSRQLSEQQQMLYARAANAGALSEESRQQAVIEQAPMRTGMTGTANSVEIVATPDAETVMKGAQPRQLLISANTRESRIAAYLDGWKRRVERVGTINFPRSVLNSPGTRNPVLEVSIAANGDLTEVIILTGSGNRDLDMAAVDILRRAAPFDRFPEYLRNDYDELKFSYEWQFTGNSVGRMTVP